MKTFERCEVEDRYSYLKFYLIDKAYDVEKAYDLYSEMGRTDLANEQLAVSQVLADIIESAGLTREYERYRDYTREIVEWGD